MEAAEVHTSKVPAIATSIQTAQTEETLPYKHISTQQPIVGCTEIVIKVHIQNYIFAVSLSHTHTEVLVHSKHSVSSVHV